MKKVLIVIDYQNDFVANDGILTAGKNAQNIEDIINERIMLYLKNKNDIIFTLDTHTKDKWQNHPEARAFPLHCQKGTIGHSLFGKIKDTAILSKGIFIEKNSYCINNDTLKQIVLTYDSIELLGVVTNICVLQNAIALYNTSVNYEKHIDFYLFEKGCASFDNALHNDSVKYIKDILKFNII